MMRGMGNMQNMMKQMQKMQKKMAEAQEQLGEEKIEGTAGGGMVTVIVTGHKEIVDVQIKPEALTQMMSRCFKTLCLRQRMMH